MSAQCDFCHKPGGDVRVGNGIWTRNLCVYPCAELYMLGWNHTDPCGGTVNIVTDTPQDARTMQNALPFMTRFTGGSDKRAWEEDMAAAKRAATSCAEQVLEEMD